MDSRYKTVFWSLSFGLWVYIILRAIYSPFVFDEATTFLLYVHNNKIIPGHAFWSANNHILNTALTWVSYNLLGPEEWQLRLPNVLAFLVFCFYLYKISLKLNNTLSRLLLVLGVLSGHVFLEMFGFSRGYGLSFAALSGAIYYGLNNLNENSLKNRVGLYLCNFLMVLANLTLLPISLMLAALTFSYMLWKARPKNHLVVHLVFLSIPIALAAYWSFQLKAKGELYYAAENGFWGGTIKSLLMAFWYGDGYVEQGIFILILLFLVFILWRSFKQKATNRNTVFTVLLFVTPFVFYPLAKLLLTVEYPLDRAILYLPFLLFVSLAFAMDTIELTASFKKIVLLVVVLPLILLSTDNASLKKATGFKWNTEQIPDVFFEEALQSNATVGGYFLRQKCWEYLNVKSEKKANVLQISDYPGSIADYQIINNYDLGLFKENYHVIQENKESELLFLKRNLPLQRDNLVAKTERLTVRNNVGFTELLVLKIDSIQHPITIDFKGELKSEANPLNGLLAISVLDDTETEILYQEIRLRNLLLDHTVERVIEQSMYYSHFEKAKTLKVFFWNRDNQDFEWANFECSVYTLKRQE